jgi:Zn-dependent protease with chaperone function
MRLAAPSSLPVDRVEDQALAGRVTPGSPPWIWLWIGLLLVSPPGVLEQWWATVHIRGQVQAMNRGGELNWGEFALHTQGWLTIVPFALMLLGVSTILVPSLRSWLSRRRYGLASLPRDHPRLGPIIQEIEAFVHAQAPGLILVGNPAITKCDPFVYPEDYRRSALAITGKFLMLWKRDRKAAEAVLLHEIGHYRRGDSRVIGAGSVFEMMIRYGVPITLALILAPTLLQFMQDLPTVMSGPESLGPAAPPAWAKPMQAGALLVARFLFACAALALWFLSSMTAPLAAIWSAEFAADRFAADQQRTAVHLQRLIASDRRSSKWTWFLSRLSHPPSALRLWMLKLRLPAGLIWLAMFFPLAYLVLRPVPLHGSTFLNVLSLGATPSEILGDLFDSTLRYLKTISNTLFAMAALLFCWPFVVRAWERIMTGDPPSSSRVALNLYWACAAFLVLLALVGIALASIEPARPRTL